MDESEVIAALVALAKQHPYAAAALGLWLALSLGWKAQPKEKREAWALVSPRLVGVLRVALELLPDLLGAARVLLWQVVRGQAARPSLEPRETQAPPPPSEPGFAETRILAVIAVASALALVALLAGCPMPAPDNCTPFATRCSPSGIPETCSQSQRWSHAPPASPCSSRGPVVCCRTRSPWGNELHACAPQSACLPETAADAGAEVSDAR
jgi:hypothetical protein